MFCVILVVDNLMIKSFIENMTCYLTKRFRGIITNLITPHLPCINIYYLRFLFYYILCGIGAGIIQEIVQFVEYQTVLSGYSMVQTFSGTIPMSEYLNMMNTVGASGAVYAILLGFGMLFPNQQLFIFPLPFPIKAKYFVIGYALIELYSGFANNPNDNVAHFAHLGGMIFGFILIMYWKKKNNDHGTYYN